MEGPPLGPGGEDITWPDQVAPRGRKASSTRKIKPQTSNLKPEAPTTPWPVLHLIARHHTHPTTHLPPQAYAWVAPWFHRTDTNPTVAWNPDHAPKWLFTTTPTWPCPDPAGVAICYSMYEPGRTGKHEHPYYPVHHSCHTPEHRTRTLTCHDLNPDTAYILHYIYSYLTQGQPEQGLIALSPKAKHIISKGIGVYTTPILQPTTPVAHLATCLAIYAYLPMNPCRLPQPSPAGRLFFTDASGRSALTPITRGGHPAANPHRGTLPHGPPHRPHHLLGLLPRGARGHGRTITEIAAHLPAHSPHILRVWFVVDATVDTHLLLRIARQPLHKATATSLGTQALLLWKALRSLPPYVQLHIVKQESHRHQYGLVRSTTRRYTSAQRSYQPSRALTSAKTTHTSNTYPPYPSPIRPQTGYQRTPPIPPTTEHTTTPTQSNISPACSATQTAGRTSRSSRTDCKSPSTTQRCAQQTSQPTSKNDASSSSGSNYHSSPGSPDGSPANTSTSPKNTPVARVTRPPRMTGNTSRNAPSIQAGKP